MHIYVIYMQKPVQNFIGLLPIFLEYLSLQTLLIDGQSENYRAPTFLCRALITEYKKAKYNISILVIKTSKILLKYIRTNWSKPYIKITISFIRLTPLYLIYFYNGFSGLSYTNPFNWYIHQLLYFPDISLSIRRKITK